jgi:tRNA(Ile2) C34 agmatinyltransferase TiaS
MEPDVQVRLRLDSRQSAAMTKPRQPDCPGSGMRMDSRQADFGKRRHWRCPHCRRVGLAVNYDGRLRRHVAHPVRL